MSGTAGIHVSPFLWNCDRLPVEEETRLLYFFKLVYMERLRQLKKWGDQRHPDGTNAERFRRQARLYKLACQRHAAEGRVTWIDILLEEAFELAETECPPGAEAVKYAKEHGLGDMESEMVQSAAVLAAWHSDKCRSTQEYAVTRETMLTSLGMSGQQAEEALKAVIRDYGGGTPAENFMADMGDDGPIATDDGASAYGLGLPGARPRHEEIRRAAEAKGWVAQGTVHLGRTKQRLPGVKAGLGDTIEVAWCTEQQVEGRDGTTRLVNLATCELCVQMWFADYLPPVVVEDSGEKGDHRDETRG